MMLDRLGFVCGKVVLHRLDSANSLRLDSWLDSTATQPVLALPHAMSPRLVATQHAAHHVLAYCQQR
jgi:fatty-acid desaturase